MKLSRRHAVLGLLAATPLALTRSDASTISRNGTAFGTTVRLTVKSGSEMHGDAAIDAGFAEIRAIERAFNLFDPASEVSRLNANGFLKSSSSLMRELVALSDTMWRKTGGAFDPTVQPLWRLWKGQQGDRPSEDEVTATRQRLGWQHVEHNASSIRFSKPGMALTFNGIAQGYAADRVIEAIMKHGILSALVDTGEIGLTPSQAPSHFVIRDPRDENAAAATLDLSRGFVATSSDYATSFTPDYSAHHIFDPATGHSPGELSSVTVVARTGAEADAWATAMMVMGRNAALSAAEAESLRTFLVLKSGQVVRSS